MILVSSSGHQCPFWFGAENPQEAYIASGYNIAFSVGQSDLVGVEYLKIVLYFSFNAEWLLSWR